MRTERFHQNLKGVILRFIPSLEIVLVVILIGYGALAEPSNGSAQKSADVSYSLKQIERLIEHYQEAQLVIGYELGEVDWSQRVLRTLAVGTHVILSPTGGWGEFDLEALAIERTRQKFERLSAEVFREERELNRCEWQTRSKLFQSQSPLWMSDGTVHLSSVIRFEVFEDCPYRGGLQPVVKGSYIELRQKSNTFLTQWVRNLNQKLKRNKRVIAYLELSTLSSTKNYLGCLKVSPQIYEVNATQELSLPWRNVRWLWDDTSNPQTSLKSRVKSSIYLGKVRCDAQKNRLVLLNSMTKMKLNRLFEREGGVELWIWVPKND